MIVFPNIETTIVKQIGILLNIAVTPSQLVLSNARAYTGTTINRDTSVDYSYAGRNGTVHYNRLSLSVLDERPRPSWTHLIHSPTVHGMLTEFSKYVGFVLVSADFDDLDIVPDGDYYIATLKASDNSIRFKDQMTIRFKDMLPIEGNLFTSYEAGYI